MNKQKYYLKKEGTLSKHFLKKKSTAKKWEKQYTYNLDNEECFFYLSINNSPFVMRFTPHLGLENCKFDNYKKYFNINNKNPYIKPTKYIVNITKKNTNELPHIDDVEYKSYRRKEFIQIIETRKLYDNYLEPYYNSKKKPYWLENLQDEKIYLEEKYGKEKHSVFWDFEINDLNFYLGPNSEKYFPIGMPSINEICVIFPWEYVCIYMGEKSLISIRDLDCSYIDTMEQIGKEIKNRLYNRFKLKKDNIIISVRHNLSSNFSKLYFNISYVYNFNPNTKFKWEDDSDILFDNFIFLLKENRNKDHVFFYGSHIKHTFFIPDKYFKAIEEYYQYDNNKLNEDFKETNPNGLHPNLYIHEYLDFFLDDYTNDGLFEKKKKLKTYLEYDDKFDIIKDIMIKGGGSNRFTILDDNEDEDEDKDEDDDEYEKNKIEKNIVLKENCSWQLGTNEDKDKYNFIQYTPKKLLNKSLERKIVYDEDHNKIITNLPLLHLFGNYFELQIITNYDKKDIISKQIYDFKLKYFNITDYNNSVEKTIKDDKLTRIKDLKSGDDEFIKKICVKFPDYKPFHTESTEKTNYGNFLIHINVGYKDIESELLNTENNEKYKQAIHHRWKDYNEKVFPLNHNIDYEKFLEKNNTLSFLGWYDSSDNKKVIYTPFEIQTYINNDKNNFISWFMDQRKQVINYIYKLFGNTKPFIKLYFHFPNAPENFILHLRIDVFSNQSYYYNRLITTDYTSRNIYMDSIIENNEKGLFLPKTLFLKNESKYRYMPEQKGGNIDEKNNDTYKWLNKYNSKIFFYGIINKNLNYEISISKKNIDNKYYKFKDILEKENNNVSRISKNTDISNYMNNKLPHSRFKYYLNNFYNKFDINIEIHKILIINYDINYDYFSKDDLKNKNFTIINDIYDLKKVNNKFDLIIIKKVTKEIDIINRLKDTLITFLLSLNLLKKNGIISLKLNLTYEPSILDTILLISNYSSLFIFCDHFSRNISDFPIYYIFSEFWKVDNLKTDINRVLNIFNFKSTYSFLKIKYISNPNLLEQIKKPSQFIINRYLELNELDNKKKLSEKDYTLIQNYLFQNVLNYNIEINPESIPIITRMLSSKLFYLPNGDSLKLHSNINMNEGNYLYNLVANNNMTQLLEVGFAYGVSAMFMTKALEFNKSKKKENTTYQLISIDPFQREQWHNLGLYNLKRIKTENFHKLYEDKSLNTLPYLLKERKKQYDLIFIDGWHTFDYALVDLFYSSFLIKQHGYLILDDALHPGVAKLIKYIDTNYMGFLKKITNGPRTFGVYIKEGDDKRDWDYHKDF